MEEMFKLRAVQSAVQDRPGARALCVTRVGSQPGSRTAGGAAVAHTAHVSGQDEPMEGVASGPGTIRFNDVTFGYPGSGREILRGLSCEIEAGTTVAVVGASGCGKSSMLRLLYRLYETDSGSITIDGVDVRDLTQESLRRNIGMVPQDTILFNDTLGYNVKYGNLNASHDDVNDVIRYIVHAGCIPVCP